MLTEAIDEVCSLSAEKLTKMGINGLAKVTVRHSSKKEEKYYLIELIYL